MKNENNDISKKTDYKNFIREFSAASIPFKEIFKNHKSFYEALFNEFIDAETKPCFSLYRKQSISGRKLNEGFENANHQIPDSNPKNKVAANYIAKTEIEKKLIELHYKFQIKVAKNKLSKKYYCQDIEKTNIVIIFKEIDEIYEILKESVFDETTNKYTEAEIRAESIISLAENLNDKILSKEVLNTLKTDNDNILLQLRNTDKNNELQNRWKALKSYFNKILLKAIEPQQTRTKINKLKVKQIALIHVYEEKQITRENSAEIATEGGYNSKTSGEGLFQDYSHYRSTANRKGKPTPCTPKKLSNKIKLFESIFEHLSDKAKQRAFDEVKILKFLFKNEYE